MVSGDLETIVAQTCSMPLISSNKNEAISIQQDRNFGNLDNTLRSFIEAYAQGETRLSQLLSRQFNSLGTQVTAEGVQTRQALSVGLNGVATRLEGLAVENVHQALLSSLKYPTMNERRNNVSESHEESFNWIFDSIQDENPSGFVQWLELPDEPLFWISGKPGSGKSTLLKFLLEDERTRTHLETVHPRILIVSHFFWMAGQLMERSIKGLLCSLLYQLLEITPIRLLGSLQLPGSLHHRSRNSHSDWSVKDLKTAISYMLRSTTSPVCIFLDALDECDPTDGSFNLLDLVQDWCRIPNVKICTSSRPEPIFRQRLGQGPMLRVQDLTTKDIRFYAEAKLRDGISAAGVTLTDGEFKELSFLVATKADGVFLWASLALRSLQRGLSNGDSLAELSSRLDALPDDLNALYKDMWQRLNTDREIYRKDAARYFNLSLDISSELFSEGFSSCSLIPVWAVALHPTLASDMLTSNTHYPSEDDISALSLRLSKMIDVRCAGLLEVVSDAYGQRKVAFVHRSAMEFLRATPDGKEILQHDNSSKQTRMYWIVKAQLALGAAYYHSFKKIHYGIGSALSYYSAMLLIVQVCHLQYHQYLTSAAAVELLDHAHDLYQTGLWKAHHPRMTPLPDFIAMVATQASVEFIPFAVEKAERKHGPLSKRYRGYLLSSALVSNSVWKRWDELDMVNKKLRIAWYLLSNGEVDTANPELCLGYQVSRTTTERPTPILCALLETALNDIWDVEVNGSDDIGTISDILDLCHQLLGFGAELTGHVLIILSARSAHDWKWEHPFDFRSLVELVNLLETDNIILELNAASLLHIFCHAVKGMALASPAKDKVATLLAAAETHKYARVISFALDESSGNDERLDEADEDMSSMSSESSRCFNPRPFFTLARTHTAPYMVELTRNRDLYSLVPGYSHIRDYFTKFGTCQTYRELQDDLVARGLLVRAKDIKDYPPSRHESSL